MIPGAVQCHCRPHNIKMRWQDFDRFNVCWLIRRYGAERAIIYEGSPHTTVEFEYDT